MMKKVNTSLFILILIIMIFIIMMFIIKYNNNQKEYNKNYDNTKTVLQNKLMQYNYEIPDDYNKQIIYIIQGEVDNLNFKRFIVSNNDTINLELNNNEQFIVSLYSNSTIDAKWVLNNYNDTNIIVNSECLLDNFKAVPKNSTGVSYTRKFFTLKYLTSNETQLPFNYFNSPYTSNSKSNFTFNINIKLKK
ncbi:MAG: hypothetical protein RSA29_14250 [Clostridium sp.]|uniref:hypothetical protein n=1 Tax=Clostridium sp. TaxID=1506 RepID=UPI0032163CD3